MRIIISPAKKMRDDTDSLEWRELPALLPQAEQLCGRLRSLPYAELRKLWKCNSQIAQTNAERLERMDLRGRLCPAILAYEGIQYQYMAPDAFTNGELAYIQEHLRILSGFYGVLRPLDGVTPYRLEMQARLQVGGAKDLYSFWGDRIAKRLFAETDCIVNLASKEYSLCVSKYLPKTVRFLTCVFGEESGGRIIEKGTLCKMARGEMARYMAENQIEAPEALKAFSRLGYQYAPEHSGEDRYVFLRKGPRRAAPRSPGGNRP
ncbi:MAG: peroxide stress protein YaaA [Clostridiales bacterium]|nr:peroxide stress protein YaaA [Clostridiales bacterium]MDO4351371.1 peroxide stress protein YaaA [Eubacteriales bacterium]MDY4008691.1 peroxide stress protein YaaA [Candidatus Limiplasma sp.]